MKIAIKHRTNDCKDYMGSHTTVIIGDLKEHNVAALLGPISQDAIEGTPY